MRLHLAATIVLVVGLAAQPVLAESTNDGGGTGPVAGEGPGGSGAGQTSGGVERLKVKRRHGTYARLQNFGRPLSNATFYSR